VRSWLSRARDCGLRVISPEAGWQAALVAASVVVSDHGSLSVYAAALGKPLILATGSSTTTVAGSAVEALATRVPRLHPERDLGTQIASASQPDRPDCRELMAELAVEVPGECASRMRPLLYRMLDLPEPDEEPTFPPYDVPATDDLALGALVVGAESTPAIVVLTRYPDLRRGRPHENLHYRHIVADLAHATAGQLCGATIVSVSPQVWHASDTLLDEWPHATMVATAPDPVTCLIRTRDGATTLRFTTRSTGLDPLVLASLAHVRMAETGRALAGRDRLSIGGTVIEVVAVAG
jgi:hypothetical protein